MRCCLLILLITLTTQVFGQDITALKAEAEAATGVTKAQKYTELAKAYQAAGNWVQAEITGRKAVQFSVQNNDPSTTTVAYTTLGTILTRIGKYAPADYNLKQGLAIAERENNIETTLESYKALAFLNKTRRRAGLELKYERLYKAMEDSIAQVANQKAIIDLEAQNKADAETRTEQVAAAEAAAKAAKTKMISFLSIAGLIVAASLAAIFLTFGFFQRKLSKQKKENKAQQQRFSKIVKAQEMDKISSATLLHSGVENALDEAQKRLNGFVEENGLQDVEVTSSILDQIKQAKDSSAELGFALVPKVLLEKGLAQALQELVKRKGKSTTAEVSFRSTPLNFNLHQETQTIVYRAVHDILTLLVDQGKADFIDVSAQQEGSEYIFHLKHNGLGWEEDALVELDDFHWESLLSKMNFLKGKAEMIKNEPRGNEFFIKVAEQKLVDTENEAVVG